MIFECKKCGIKVERFYDCYVRIDKIDECPKCGCKMNYKE